MKVNYIIQPDTQLGKILSDMLNTDPSASRIVFVSAFVSVQTIIRVKQQMGTLKNPVFRRVLRVVDELLAGLYRHGSKMRVILYDSLCGVIRSIIACSICRRCLVAISRLPTSWCSMGRRNDESMPNRSSNESLSVSIYGSAVAY